MLLKFNRAVFLLTITFSTMGSKANQPPVASSLISSAQSFVDNFNKAYEAKHYAFEQQFWGTKMALSDVAELKFSAENLSKTKGEM